MSGIGKSLLRITETRELPAIRAVTGDVGTFVYAKKISDVPLKDVSLTFNGRGMAIAGIASDGTIFSCPGGNINIHEGEEVVDVWKPIAYISP